jgi:tetratricopeptide (TPR) repeat protein
MQKMADEQFYRQMRDAAFLLQRGNGKNAASILKRLRDLYPDNVDVAVNLGAAYILSKQYAEAVPVLEFATAAADNNPAAWVNLAAAYLGTLQTSTKEKQDKAIDAFQQALEVDPYYPNVHYNLGLIYQDRRDWARAREMFQGALKTNPDDKDARNLLLHVEKRLEEERSS